MSEKKFHPTHAIQKFSLLSSWANTRTAVSVAGFIFHFIVIVIIEQRLLLSIVNLIRASINTD